MTLSVGSLLRLCLLLGVARPVEAQEAAAFFFAVGFGFGDEPSCDVCGEEGGEAVDVVVVVVAVGRHVGFQQWCCLVWCLSKLELGCV